MPTLWIGALISKKCVERQVFKRTASRVRRGEKEKTAKMELKKTYLGRKKAKGTPSCA